MIAVQHPPRATPSRSAWKQLADEVREQPLEEIAVQLGLERDRHDKHKWRGAGCCISINDNKFFDFYTNQGGVGAINFVMYVREVSFQEALSWLTNGASRWEPSVVPLPEVKPKKCNIRDESRWPAARKYLTEQRGLPVDLVEALHNEGMISVDCRQNIMFFRCQITPEFERGAAIGLSLRGTIPDPVTGEYFKGLSPGTTREEGYFWFRRGEGSIQRMVVTEAPIDALSFAVLEDCPKPTVFLSTDGQGAVPLELFERLLDRGGELVLAHDCDRQGELMAWQIAEQFPDFTLQRQTPAIGKDWNDQLLKKVQAVQPRQAIAADLWQWYRLAPRAERPDIIQIGLEFNTSKHPRDLTDEELARMRRAIASTGQEAPKIDDLSTQQPTLEALRDWYRKARDLGRSSRHLKQIERVGKAFVQGQPVSTADLQRMANDIARWEEQVLLVSVQARYLLSAMGSGSEVNLTLGDQTYLLYEQEEYLYVLTHGRGMMPTREDMQILPQTVFNSGWRIILKTMDGAIEPGTRVTAADVQRFQQLIERFQSGMPLLEAGISP